MEDKKIWSFFKKAKRKIVGNLLLQNLIVFTMIGLLIGTGIHTVALFVPIYDSLFWAFMAVGVTIVLGLLYTIIRCPNNQEIALIVDSKGLEEQLVTSMELKDKEDNISSLQKQKTLEAISDYSIKERLPFKWSFTNMLLLGFSTLAFVIAAIIPSDAKSQALALHELKKIVEEEKDKVEEVKKEVTKLEETNKAELAELKKILEDSLKEIKETEKEKDLEKAKERMETKLKKELEKQDSELSRQLSQMLEKKDMIKKTAEEKEQEEQEKELREQLEQLQKQLSQSKENGEKAQSQEQNNGESGENKDKNKSENGNGESDENGEGKNETETQESQNNSQELMELSEQLQQMANNGQLSAEEMQQLAQSIAQANNALANSSLSNQQMQALTGQLSQTLASAGNASVSQQATASMGKAPSSNSSTGQNGSQGGNSSQSGNGTGNGNGGSGNGAGSGNRGSGGNGSGGTGYSTGSKNGVEKEYVKNTSEEITIPEEVGDDENLTGKAGGTGKTYTQKSKNGPAWAGNSVDYSQVVGDYANQAYSNVENNKVPDSMKEIIKSYFTGLTN